MSAGLVVLWLGAASARATHEPDLASWADSRMTELEEPSAEGALGPAPHEDDIAKQAEDSLAEARAATFSADPSAARATLDAVETLLTNHPELPEAAWLMAEAWRVRAETLRATDPTAADALDRRASSLDGPQARAFEPKAPAHAARPSAASTPLAPTTSVPLLGPLSSDEIEVDGGYVGRPPTVSEGLHVVRVLRHGRLAWAGWVTASADPVRAPVPGVAPCSETDLASLRITGDHVTATDSVACPHFALARAVSADRIEVSVCEHAACGTWLPWNRTWGQSFEGPMQPIWPKPHAQTWIWWTAAGIVTVVAGGVLLQQEGVFESHGAPRDSFVWVPPGGK